MKRARLVFAAMFATTASGALACEVFTHADDYAVNATPYSGWCNECPATNEDLRHPPCPSSDGVDGDDGQQHVYATRALHFGHPSDWQGANASSFHLGYDLDCSSRPDGVPVLCAPIAVDGGPHLPWQSLPHGIDNSLMQRIFAPLYDLAKKAGRDIDLDAEYSAQQNSGELGLLVLVRGWNGGADDANVVVDITSSPGISPDNGPPRWNGTDRWDRYDDIPGMQTRYYSISNMPCYVASGQLVCDYRFAGDVSLRFGSPSLSFRLLVHDVTFAGTIDADHLDYFTMNARADLASAYDEIDETAQVLSGCDPVGEAYLESTLGDLLAGAADLPSSVGAPVDQTCDSVSFSWALDAQKALLGGYRMESDADAGADAACLLH